MAERDLAPLAQWIEPRAGTRLASYAVWVENGDGSFSLSLTGSADAYLAEDGSGSHTVDESATVGSPILVVDNVAHLVDMRVRVYLSATGTVVNFTDQPSTEAYWVLNGDGSYSPSLTAAGQTAVYASGSTVQLIG